MAGVLVWLWISNIAILMGAEFDAELERWRAMAAGHPEDAEPYVQLRDDRKVKKGKAGGMTRDRIRPSATGSVNGTAAKS